MTSPPKSTATKQPMSGLRSIKRDFSSNSVITESQVLVSGDAASIPWRETPSQKDRTGMSERLRHIQEGIEASLRASDNTMAANGSGNLLQAAKRSGTSLAPPAKRRQLPASWIEPQQSSGKTARSFGAERSANSQILSIAVKSTESDPAKPGAVNLSLEQKHILQLVQAGESVFYTGSAGTGKSVLLREIIKTLRQKYWRAPDCVAVTASTGIAACNIGGVTIHSFAGIGIGVDEAEKLASRVKKNKKAESRWLRTRVLIIDEVSMVDGALFDKLDEIGRIVRKRLEPFGGIQLIVTGDFFQLPPVNKSGNVKFAFEADSWSQSINKTFNLTKVFRQRDLDFVDMLNEMRFGTLTQKSIAKFRSLSREIIYEDGLGATELFPRREDVDRSNETRMRGIVAEQRTYFSQDGGTITDEQQRQKMLANFMAPAQLTLKIGAQVMLIKNIDDTLVNGSIGKIIDFRDPASGPGDPSGKPSSKTGKQTKTASASTAIRYPVVEFLQPGGGTRTHLVEPENWKVEQPTGEVQVSRTQLPLILAWAMSIHKSQGQTLERVKVDLGRIFEKGQAYVALSRATSLDGLQVLNFDPKKVQAHPRVVAWTKTLETIPDL